MAQRYPDDFDGIFARAPVINWVGLQHAGTRSGLVTMGGCWINPARVKLVADAVRAACDKADGSDDALVQDPVACLCAVRHGWSPQRHGRARCGQRALVTPHG